MPIPDLCILECVITGYYKLIHKTNVIVLLIHHISDAGREALHSFLRQNNLGHAVKTGDDSAELTKKEVKQNTSFSPLEEQMPSRSCRKVV